MKANQTTNLTLSRKSGTITLQEYETERHNLQVINEDSIQYHKDIEEFIMLWKRTDKGKECSNYECIFHEAYNLNLKTVKKLIEDIEAISSSSKPDKEELERLYRATEDIKYMLNRRTTLTLYQKIVLDLFYPVVDIKLRHLSKKAQSSITIGEKIKDARVNHNYSMDFLATSIGMSRSYLHKLEHNNALRPGIEILQKIANVLNMQVIFNDDNEIDLVAKDNYKNFLKEQILKIS